MSNNEGPGWHALILIGLIGAGVCGCSSDDRTETDNASYSDSGYSERLSEDQLEDVRADARADAVSDLAASSYEGEGSAYGCTEDCSGHEAGWQWAAENEVQDASDCGGYSMSFEEGCQAFAEAVEERANDAASEYEGG